MDHKSDSGAIIGESRAVEEALLMNLKIPGSNHVRCLAGLKDQSSLRGSRCLLFDIRIMHCDQYWLSKAFPSPVAQSWPWGSQAAG